jgi:hypothetical protein
MRRRGSSCRSAQRQRAVARHDVLAPPRAELAARLPQLGQREARGQHRDVQRARRHAPAQRLHLDVFETVRAQRRDEVFAHGQRGHGPAVGPQAVQPAGQAARFAPQQKAVDHGKARTGLEQARGLANEVGLGGALGVAGALHGPGTVGLRGGQAGAGVVGLQVRHAVGHAGGGVEPGGDAVLHGHVGHGDGVQRRIVADQRARGGAGAAAQVEHAAARCAALRRRKLLRGEPQRAADDPVHFHQHALAAQRVQAGAPEAEVHVVAGAPGAVVDGHFGEVVPGVLGGDGRDGRDGGAGRGGGAGAAGRGVRRRVVRHAEVGLENGGHGSSLAGLFFGFQRRQLPSSHEGATRPASRLASQRGMR